MHHELNDDGVLYDISEVIEDEYEFPDPVKNWGVWIEKREEELFDE